MPTSGKTATPTSRSRNNLTLIINLELQCKALKLASLIDTQLLCQAELAERCVSVIDHFDPVDRWPPFSTILINCLSTVWKLLTAWFGVFAWKVVTGPFRRRLLALARKRCEGGWADFRTIQVSSWVHRCGSRLRQPKKLFGINEGSKATRIASKCFESFWIFWILLEYLGIKGRHRNQDELWWICGTNWKILNVGLIGLWIRWGQCGRFCFQLWEFVSCIEFSGLGGSCQCLLRANCLLHPAGKSWFWVVLRWFEYMGTVALQIANQIKLLCKQLETD